MAWQRWRVRILVVLPDTDLDTQSELISAVSGNRPEILAGTVTVREVLRHIASGEYEAVHFGTHGKANAMEMSDGTIDAEQFETAIKAAGRNGQPPRLVFLNACESIISASRIYSISESGPSHVIGWRVSPTDSIANLFAARFYRSLAMNGKNIHEAFDSARYAVEHEGQESPLMLNGRIDDLRISIKNLLDKIGSLERAVSAPEWGIVTQRTLTLATIVALLISAGFDVWIWLQLLALGG